MHYFAYGSCLPDRELMRTCPHAHFLMRGRLEDYDLRFTHFSPRRKGGVADIVPVKGCCVWGAVHDVPEEDIPALDEREGYKGPTHRENTYRRFHVTIHLDDGGTVDAETFEIAQPAEERIRTHIPPHMDYLDLILQGAEERRLPRAYIAMLPLKAEEITCFR